MAEDYPKSPETAETDQRMSAADRLQIWINEHPKDGYLRYQAHSILTDPESLRIFQERFPGQPLTQEELAEMPGPIIDQPEAE